MPPPPPNTPNHLTWTPPPNPPSRSPPPPPSPLLDPPSNPPPPPQGASGQQSVGGVVGVQNRGVAPPGVEGGKLLKQFVHHTKRPLNQPTNSNLEAFGGPMARARWAWRPLCGSPWVLKYPYCH